MAASLAEEQGRKQAAALLPEQPEAELRRRFARSVLLPKVIIVQEAKFLQNCGPAGLWRDSNAARFLRMAKRRLHSVASVSVSHCSECVCDGTSWSWTAAMQFEGTGFGGALFAPALRPQLVALLELERQYRALW
jgi:hypothetical protein